MILLGISRPRVYKKSDASWHIAFHHIRTDTAEPGIYKGAGASADMPVHNQQAGLSVAAMFCEMFRVFREVPTTIIGLDQ